MNMIKEVTAAKTANIFSYYFKCLPIRVLPVVDRYRSIKSCQRYWTFIVQLLLLISEGHSHGN